MEQPRKRIDRRRYEKRGMAVPAKSQGRGLSESTLSTLQKQLVKRYGEGWEMDTVYPGTICNTPKSIDMEEGRTWLFLNDADNCEMSDFTPYAFPRNHKYFASRNTMNPTSLHDFGSAPPA